MFRELDILRVPWLPALLLIAVHTYSVYGQVSGDVLPGTWVDTFGGYPSVEGEVMTLTQLQTGELAIGGSFTRLEGRPAHNIAILDGDDLILPPEGLRSVEAIVPFAGGLLVAGDMRHVHDGVNHGLALWKDGTWHPLIEDVRVAGVSIPYFHDITVYDGVAYVGGEFSELNGVRSKGVIAWDGADFVSLEGGVDGEYIFDIELSDVFALDVTDDGLLVIGGSFDEAGGVPAHKLAIWDGHSWTGIGSEQVYSVRTLEAVTADSIFVSGAFTDASGNVTDGIRLWNGVSFESLGPGVDATPTSLSRTDDGRLLVAGVTASGNTYLGGIGVWDGRVWSPVATPLFGRVRSAIQLQDGSLAAGGTMASTGERAAADVAVYQEGKWTSLFSETNQGLLGTPRDFATDPTTGDLIVAGPIYATGQQFLGQAARWNGSAWSRIELIPDAPMFAMATAVDAAGRVFIGGSASPHGLTSSGIVVQVDGDGASVVGRALNGRVEALAACPDGYLYVGGRMTSAGDQVVNHIARWNGDDWQSLGGGLDSVPTDIECDIDGEGIVASGYFESSGIVELPGIGRWSDGAWTRIGGGVERFDYISSITWRGDGTLIAGGNFETIDGVPANNIAVWDGTAWSEFGGGVSSDVHSVTEDETGTVYAAGYFHQAGGISAPRVAGFRNGRWFRLTDEGSGVVWDVLATKFGIVFGGGFSYVDGVRSNRIAIFRPDQIVAVDDSPTNGQLTATIGAFPNPATDQVTFQIDGPLSRRCLLEIYDSLGRTAQILDCPEQGAPSDISWKAGGHASGTYHAVLIDAAGRRGPSVSIVVL